MGVKDCDLSSSVLCAIYYICFNIKHDSFKSDYLDKCVSLLPRPVIMSTDSDMYVDIVCRTSKIPLFIPLVGCIVNAGGDCGCILCV